MKILSQLGAMNSPSSHLESDGDSPGHRQYRRCARQLSAQMQCRFKLRLHRSSDQCAALTISWTNIGSSLIGTNGLGLFRHINLPAGSGRFARERADVVHI